MNVFQSRHQAQRRKQIKAKMVCQFSFFRDLKVASPVKCDTCAVNQNIVAAWFSGNALISMEALRIP